MPICRCDPIWSNSEQLGVVGILTKKKWNLQAASAGRFTWGIWGTGEIFRNLPCVGKKGGIQKGHEVCIAQVLGSFWKGGCYEIFSIFYKVLDPFPVSCLSFTHFNRFRSHIFKLAKVKIRLLGAPAVSDRHWVQTLKCKEAHAGHASFLAWQAHYDLKDPAGLAGFLIESDIKLIRAESGSPDESSRHKSQGDMKQEWDAQHEEKTSFQLA